MGEISGINANNQPPRDNSNSLQQSSSKKLNPQKPVRDLNPLLVRLFSPITEPRDETAKLTAVAMDPAALLFPGKTRTATFEAIATNATLLRDTNYRTLAELRKNALNAPRAYKQFLKNATRFIQNTKNSLFERYLVADLVLTQAAIIDKDPKVVTSFERMLAELRPQVEARLATLDQEQAA